MATNKLIIGNMNYSSWSFRPWIAMRFFGIGFEEQVIPLFSEGYKAAILEYSPAGQVPVFIHHRTAIWGSLAILEFMAEKFPDKGFWPMDVMERAQARSVVGEMHSGFSALRNAMPMNVRRTPAKIDYDADVAADIQRINRIWTHSRADFDDKGPFLFGAFSIADAMFAPVVSRFHVYDVALSKVSHDYMETMMALPVWKEWHQAAIKEPWVIENYER